MRIVGVVVALIIGLSAGACNRGLFAGASGGGFSTSPARILVENALLGAGFRDISRLTTNSWNSAPHGLNASFQATARRGEITYRVSGVYDVLAGIVIESMAPVGHW